MFLFSILKSGANPGEIIIYILAMALSATIAIVLHEISHGYAALANGDYTAKSNNRLTLNPAAHFDLIGLAMLLLVGFGWARPVPIDPRNFRNYKKGMITVSAAGIITNIILCGIGLLLIFLLKPIFLYTGNISVTFYGLRMFAFYFLMFFTKINFMLAFFNILPIYPLDGFRLLNCFLKHGNPFTQFMHKYGNITLIVLIVVSSILRNTGLYFLDIFYWGNYLINRLIGLVL